MRRFPRPYQCGRSNLHKTCLNSTSFDWTKKTREASNTGQINPQSRTDLKSDVSKRIYKRAIKKRDKQNQSYTGASVQKLRISLKCKKSIFNLYKLFADESSKGLNEKNLKELLPIYGINPQKIDFQEMISLITKGQAQQVSMGSFIKFIKQESPPKESKLHSYCQSFKTMQKSNQVGQTPSVPFQRNQYHNPLLKRYKQLKNAEKEKCLVEKMQQVFQQKAKGKSLHCRSAVSFKTNKHQSDSFGWYHHKKSQFIPQKQPSKSTLMNALEEQRHRDKERYAYKLGKMRQSNQKYFVESFEQFRRPQTAEHSALKFTA